MRSYSYLVFFFHLEMDVQCNVCHHLARKVPWQDIVEILFIKTAKAPPPRLANAWKVLLLQALPLSETTYLSISLSSKLFWVFHVNSHQVLTRTIVSVGTFILERCFEMQTRIVFSHFLEGMLRTWTYTGWCCQTFSCNHPGFVSTARWSLSHCRSELEMNIYGQFNLCNNPTKIQIFVEN